MRVTGGWRRWVVALAAAACLAEARAEEDGGREPLAIAAIPRPAARVEAEPAAGRAALELKPKLKLKARLDVGDLRKNADRTAYERGADAYLDKVRFGVSGRILARGKFTLTFEARDLGRTGKERETRLDRAYVEWAFADALTVRFGQSSLPLSRGSLLSSNDVFLEDAEVVDAAGKVFFGTRPVHLQVRGRLLGGVVSYHAALADRWGPSDPVEADGAPGGLVRRYEPLVVLRTEVAVPGFTQGLEEGEPGEGRRLSVGASFASQSSIAYVQAGGREDRRFVSADLTARVGPFSGVLEVDAWRVRSTDAGVGTVSPWGWYGQVAWYVDRLRLEPALRYDRLQELGARGAFQEAVSLGLTWYVRGDDAKVAVNWTSRSFGPLADDRLDRASRRDLLEIGGELAF